MATAGLIAAGLTVAGTAFQMYGSFKQAAASKRSESLRKRQMELEANRSRREQIRRAAVARAKATAMAYNQGAGESSALAGGQAQVTSQANRNILGLNQDETLGRGIFKQAGKYADGGMIATAGAGLSSFGGAVAQAGPTLSKMYGI